MNQFKCDKCDAHCIVTVPNKSQHSNKKKPDGCIYSIISLRTNESIAVWKKMPPQRNGGTEAGHDVGQPQQPLCASGDAKLPKTFQIAADRMAKACEMCEQVLNISSVARGVKFCPWCGMELATLSESPVQERHGG